MKNTLGSNQFQLLFDLRARMELDRNRSGRPVQHLLGVAVRVERDLVAARVVRLSKRTPSHSSNPAMRLLTTARDRSISRAAAVMLPMLATPENSSRSEMLSIIVNGFSRECSASAAHR